VSGLFITIEGIEGSGKSSQVSNIIGYLEELSFPCLATREPGGTQIADEIRSLLLESKEEDIEPLTELLLYNAARAQHVSQVIWPALKDGTTVLCDRFCDATVAYQAYGRGLPLSQVIEINGLVCQGLKPDLTILLDCEVTLGLERSLQRLHKEQSLEDRFEKEDLDFHQRVRKGYLELAEHQRDRIVVIDAAQNTDQVFDHIKGHLKTHIS